MSIPLQWSDGGQPWLPLILHDDRGPFAELPARLDLSWSGELALPAAALRPLRLAPLRAVESWVETNPEPVEGWVGAAQLPAWRGRCSIASLPPAELRVHEAHRGMTEHARAGLGLLRRFGMLLILDPERREGELLSRSQR